MYAGPFHMYPSFVSDILINRGDFAADWWEMVQPRVRTHRELGTSPEQLADVFSDEWRMIRDSGGWKGRQDAPPSDVSEAMKTTLRFCAAARRHGFA